MTGATSKRFWPIGNAGYAPSLATHPKAERLFVEPALCREYSDGLSGPSVLLAQIHGFHTCSRLWMKRFHTSGGGKQRIRERRESERDTGGNDYGGIVTTVK